MQEFYWKADKSAFGAMAFWEDSLRSLPTTPKESQRVGAGHRQRVGSRDFLGTAYGQHEGIFDGFKLSDSNVQLDDTLLRRNSLRLQQSHESLRARSADGLAKKVEF